MRGPARPASARPRRATATGTAPTGSTAPYGQLPAVAVGQPRDALGELRQRRARCTAAAGLGRRRRDRARPRSWRRRRRRSARPAPACRRPTYELAVRVEHLPVRRRDGELDPVAQEGGEGVAVAAAEGGVALAERPDRAGEPVRRHRSRRGRAAPPGRRSGSACRRPASTARRCRRWAAGRLQVGSPRSSWYACARLRRRAGRGPVPQVDDRGAGDVVGVVGALAVGAGRRVEACRRRRAVEGRRRLAVGVRPEHAELGLGASRYVVWPACAGGVDGVAAGSRGGRGWSAGRTACDGRRWRADRGSDQRDSAASRGAVVRGVRSWVPRESGRVARRRSWRRPCRRRRSGRRRSPRSRWGTQRWGRCRCARPSVSGTRIGSVGSREHRDGSARSRIIAPAA